jgi:hypothetical protein
LGGVGGDFLCVRGGVVSTLVTVKIFITCTVPIYSTNDADIAMDRAETAMREAMPNVKLDLQSFGADDVTVQEIYSDEAEAIRCPI